MKNLIYEIHIFLGKGRVDENWHYPVGEMHAFIFYLRQTKGSELDWFTAEQKIAESGIHQVEFSKAGKLDPTRITEKNVDPYKSALSKGSSLVIYKDPIFD